MHPESAEAVHAGPDRRSNNPLVVAGLKVYERRPTSRHATRTQPAGTAAAMYRGSPLHDEPFLHQDVADTVAQIPLKFDRAVLRCPARAACALELLTQVLQKRGVAWKAVHHGYCFPAAPLF